MTSPLKGVGNREISEADRHGSLGRKLVANMERMTRDRHTQRALDNAAHNRSFLHNGASLAALRNEKIGAGVSALVAAAGPSVKRNDPAKLVKATGYRGALVVTESAIAYWLRNGVVPDLAVTVDPDPTRIVRWFGDPELTEEKIRKDDYFSRQDQDTYFTAEMRANDEVLRLLDRHGKDIRIALSTSASAAVVNRVLEIGMPVYWWNPMLDDPDHPDSATARLQKENRLPCVNAGGNVGSAAWMMAGVVLGKEHVALTGMDFSYYDGTPYRNTQYYHEAVALVGEENLDSLFLRIRNPYTNSWFYTDPAYMWYREGFLDLAADAAWKTYNCTGGGILFGEPIEFMPLADFLKVQS